MSSSSGRQTSRQHSHWSSLAGRWHFPRDSIEWMEGDQFALRYPDSRRFRHRFYTGPPGDPDSEKVRKSELDVPKGDMYQILEITRVQLRDDFFVAVRFSYKERSLWTNVDKNEHAWAWRGVGYLTI